MRLLMHYWFSSWVKTIRFFVKLEHDDNFFGYIWKWKFDRFRANIYRLKPRSSLCSIFLSILGLWKQKRNRKRFACSESNPVHSNRSKSTICPRKGRLLRFPSNCTVTPDGCTLNPKSWDDLLSDFELIATKVCRQNGSNEKLRLKAV